MATDTLCQMCGVVGNIELLVYCSKCKISAEHRYCLFNLPKSRRGDVIWYCEQCVPSFSSTRFSYKLKASERRKKVGRYQQPQIDCAGEKGFATIPANKYQNPNEMGNFSEVEADTCKSVVTSRRCPPDIAKVGALCDNVPLDEPKSLNSERFVVNGQRQFKGESVSFSDWLSCGAKCNSSVGCLHENKFLPDQSLPKDENVGGPGPDISPASKSLKSISKGSIIKMKRRRVVLDDEEQSDEGIVAKISMSRSAQCDYLDVKEEKNVHPGSKSHEEGTIKRKRKLVLDDEYSDEECAAMNVAEVSVIKSNFLQSSESDSSNIKVSLEMGRCNRDSVDLKVDKLSKGKRRRLILDDEYSGEEASYGTISQHCVDVVIDVHQGNEPSPDLCLVKDGRSQSPSSIADTGTSDQCVIESQPVPSDATADSLSCIPALPIIDPVWRGCFDICSEVCFPVVAHLSSKACKRVCKGARMLPSIICLDKKSRLQSQPDSLRRSQPTSDTIALYFFPYSDSVSPVYDQVLGEAIVRDVVLKVVFEEAELLVFPSTELPRCHQRFRGKYYFWGVFRRKQAPGYCAPSCISSPKESAVIQSLCMKDSDRRLLSSTDACVKEELTEPTDRVAALEEYTNASSQTLGPISDFIELSIQKSPLKQQNPVHSDIGSPPNTGLFAKIHLLCKSMDSSDFWDIVVSQKAELEALQLRLPLLLCECVDPVGFVMDTMSTVFPHEKIDCTSCRNHEWACLLMLESLASAMGMSESGSRLLSAVGVRERARKIADSWKDARKKWILKTTMTPPYAHTFLLHVVTFGIVMEEEKELYRKLMMGLSSKKKIVDIALLLGLCGETMIGMITELIDKGYRMHALNLIYGAGLVDKFPPVLLLKSHLGALKLTAPRKRKIHALDSVKLEDELTTVPLEKQIRQLKNEENKVMQLQSSPSLHTNGPQDLVKEFKSEGKESVLPPVCSPHGGLVKPVVENGEGIFSSEFSVVNPLVHLKNETNQPSSLPSLSLPVPPPPLFPPPPPSLSSPIPPPSPSTPLLLPPPPLSLPPPSLSVSPHNLPISSCPLLSQHTPQTPPLSLPPPLSPPLKLIKPNNGVQYEVDKSKKNRNQPSKKNNLRSVIVSGDGRLAVTCTSSMTPASNKQLAVATMSGLTTYSDKRPAVCSKQSAPTNPSGFAAAPKKKSTATSPSGVAAATSLSSVTAASKNQSAVTSPSGVAAASKKKLAATSFCSLGNVPAASNKRPAASYKRFVAFKKQTSASKKWHVAKRTSGHGGRQIRHLANSPCVAEYAGVHQTRMYPSNPNPSNPNATPVQGGRPAYFVYPLYTGMRMV